MKLTLNIIRTNPNSIEEILVDDVADFLINDSSISITYNNKKSDIFELRANDGENVGEWAGFSVFGTRVGLQVDMTK